QLHALGVDRVVHAVGRRFPPQEGLELHRLEAMLAHAGLDRAQTGHDVARVGAHHAEEAARPAGAGLAHPRGVGAAEHGGRRRRGLDPVTAEVIRGAMETIAYEMATHVSLTATTPILNQSNERNATILDASGALAALSVGIPQFMLSSTLPVRFALEFFGPGGLHDGDVLVANDPYHGGGHLPDYNVFAPVFHAGELVLIASIQCHHADTGGGMP